jgi:hypothetical protein
VASGGIVDAYIFPTNINQCYRLVCAPTRHLLFCSRVQARCPQAITDPFPNGMMGSPCGMAIALLFGFDSTRTHKCIAMQMPQDKALMISRGGEFGAREQN